jgi:hypothetical protein
MQRRVSAARGKLMPAQADNMGVNFLLRGRTRE